jgi:predicted amidohydrolase YtcJ
MKASLVLTNGRIYTQDGGRNVVEALAVAGGRIVATGDNAAMLALLGADAKAIDLGGRCVIPGLVDAHVHFQSYSLRLRQVDLAGSADLDEALGRIVGHLEKGSGADWLRGGGWNQEEWLDGRFPEAADLDKVVPERPAIMWHKSAHAAWVNSRALRIANIGPDTPDPPGGHIQRFEDGLPTGILFEEAIDLASDCAPRPTDSQIVEAMREAQDRCIRAGLTGIHDFDGRSCFRALQRLRADGELKLRVVKNIPVYRLEHAIGVGLRTGFGDEWLQIGGVKIFADGALGPRTAAMIEAYVGEPENRGIVVTDKEEMVARATEASANGLSVTIHAIGDRANHDVLDVYEAVRAEEARRRVETGGGGHSGGRLRHRIEHAQIVHPNDFKRFAELDVIASMQPIHATSDMAMADRYWGGRARYSYAWRTLLDNGTTLVFGSDAPIDPIEPLTGLFAAVTRRSPDGSPDPEGWYPEQRLSVAEAVQAYTMGAAVTSGREGVLGSIETGKLADFTILDSDIFSVSPDELREASIAGTVVGGQLLYRTW